MEQIPIKLELLQLANDALSPLVKGIDETPLSIFAYNILAY